MRLAFWRAGKDKTVVQRVVSKPAPVAMPVAASETGDLDLHALGQALKRKRGWIIVPTVLAAILSITAVNMITPGTNPKPASWSMGARTFSCGRMASATMSNAAAWTPRP